MFFLSVESLLNLLEHVSTGHVREIYLTNINSLILLQSQSAYTCSKLTIETLEQGVTYIQS